VHIHGSEGATPKKMGQVREYYAYSLVSLVYPEKDQKEFGYERGKLPYEAMCCQWEV